MPPLGCRPVVAVWGVDVQHPGNLAVSGKVGHVSRPERNSGCPLPATKPRPEKLDPFVQPRAAPVAGPWTPAHEPRRLRPTWGRTRPRPADRQTLRQVGGRQAQARTSPAASCPRAIRAPTTSRLWAVGALFYALRPQVAFLYDDNERLVRTYRGIRDDVQGVIRHLKKYPHDSEFYLRFRKKEIDRAGDAEVAAWLIYLNKTGFNGLYRGESKERVQRAIRCAEQPDHLRRGQPAGLRKATAPRGGGQGRLLGGARSGPTRGLRVLRPAVHAPVGELVVRVVHQRWVRTGGSPALAGCGAEAQATGG